jgi:hypothetical protein
LRFFPGRLFFTGCSRPFLGHFTAISRGVHGHFSVLIVQNLSLFTAADNPNNWSLGFHGVFTAISRSFLGVHPGVVSAISRDKSCIPRFSRGVLGHFSGQIVQKMADFWVHGVDPGVFTVISRGILGAFTAISRGILGAFSAHSWLDEPILIILTGCSRSFLGAFTTVFESLTA